MIFPRMFRIEQQFDAPRVNSIPQTVHQELDSLGLGQVVKPNETVAITAGSRGIANIALIIRAIADYFKQLDAVPFIVPAMGSHGGGTAEGQQSVIEEYGITSEFIGAEIRSAMDTVIVKETSQGFPVHFDKHAYQADHVLVCGRIKPHTGFVGEIESGLHKMMLIGLGKHEGAKIYHRAIQNYSFAEIIQTVSQVVLENCKVLGGLAIVENAYDETGLLKAVAPSDFYEEEKRLLSLAKSWMPKLPFHQVDLLIVDEIGKNISGSGMDTNVIGRKFNDHVATEQDGVNCHRIMVRRISRESHGNACGIGIAEFTTEACVKLIDQKATRINCVTGGHPTAGAIPLTYPTEKLAMAAALQTVGLIEPEQAKVIQIADTLHLKEVLVSEAYTEELKSREDLVILNGPDELTFSADDELADVRS